MDFIPNEWTIISPDLADAIEDLEYANAKDPMGILMFNIKGLRQSARCPSPHSRIYDLPCGAIGKLSVIIIHLNDAHKWSREAIADWLESLDIDLSFRSDDVIP